MDNFIILIITGISTGIISAIIASHLYDKLRERREKQPLTTLLNFGKKEELLFVFPHRDDIVEKPKKPIDILPRTSTEDFLAINNIKSALLKIHWEGKDSVKQPDGLGDPDITKNIFSICSMKSNKFTAKVENLLIAQKKIIYRVEQVPNKTHEFFITDGIGKFESKTYRQVEDYLANGIPKNRLNEQTYEDFGYITKITNPYNSDTNHKTKIYIVAGIRGIGTWGAGECIKKNWKKIYDKIDSTNKEASFSALIQLKYESMDISEIKVISVNTFVD